MYQNIHQKDNVWEVDPVERRITARTLEKEWNRNKRICVINSSYIISFIHPPFDIHLHPYEMFIFKCSPSLRNARIARLVQIENYYCVSNYYYI